MGESERYLEYKHLAKKRFYLGSKNNALMSLVSLNAIFFLLLLLMQVVYFFYNQSAETYNDSVIKWFELPSDFNVFIQRPWTLITFMFSDTSAGLWRLLSNMFWMWTFGYILRDIAGNEKVVPVYIYGGLLSGVFFIASSFFTKNFALSLIGANGSILAIAATATTLSPSHRVLTHIRKGIPLWVLFCIYIAVDIIGINHTEWRFLCSHIMGAFSGWLFAILLRKGVDGSVWMNSLYSWFVNLFTPTFQNKKTPINDTLYYNAGNRPPFTNTTKTTQDRIDEILDKINAKGFNALTEEEKQFLQNASTDETL
jgi:membrane associated rhomboid family serine protease